MKKLTIPENVHSTQNQRQKEMYFRSFLPFLFRSLLYPAVILQKGPSLVNIMNNLSAFNCNRRALIIYKYKEKCLENESKGKLWKVKVLLEELTSVEVQHRLNLQLSDTDTVLFLTSEKKKHEHV